MIDNQNLTINKNNHNSLENCSTNNNLINATPNNNENKVNLIEKMSSSEVTDMLIQLLLICWASSAGNLQYAYMNTNILLNENNKSCSRTISNSSNGSKQQQQQQQNEDNTITKTTDDLISTPKQSKEVKFCLQDHRLSTGSNMSTSSMDSNENHNQQQQQQYSPLISSGQLHSGICIKQTSISNKDIKIALKAIEMISCFLYHRKDAISSFLSLKIFSDCVIDVLTGSISNKIRVYMKKFLLKLGQLETSSGLENNES